MPNMVNQNSSAPTQLSAQERVARHQFTPDKSKLPKNIKVQEKGMQNLDKNSYLKLLITELSRQDPLNPVNDKEFISQMAQFSALEQMQNVASSVNGLKNFQATSLVGKVVAGRDFVHHKEIRGKVSGVIFDGSGEAILRVNGKTMRLKDVISVSEPRPEPKPMQAATLPPQQNMTSGIVSRETMQGSVSPNNATPGNATQEYMANQAKTESTGKNNMQNDMKKGELQP